MRAAAFAILAAGAIAAIAVSLLAATSSAPAPVFRDVTATSGVRFQFRSDLRRLKMIATMNGGCAFGDADGDGRPDLYVTNSVPQWGKPNTRSCGRLYRNVGEGRFQDVTEASGVRACGLGMGAFWVDLDSDATSFQVIRFGDFELDTARFELRQAGNRIAIEPQVFDLLVFLVETSTST